jgi:hypothetical protein
MISVLIFGASFNLAQAATNLRGRILLQVQDVGQAWYVNPLNYQRYYLGRPDDAFNVMRSLGLGVSNTDLALFFKSVPPRLAGRILLQVQDKGQAYYVDPVELKLYYLGRPQDAFNVMRARGLGITNADLNKIPVASVSLDANKAATITSRLARFAFKYQNTYREIFLPLSASLYQAYLTSPKVYTYPVNNPPADVREAFYGLFLKLKVNDTSLDDIIQAARLLAVQNNWGEDQTAEFILALVQYIPYDNSKVVNDLNTDPFYPYETLYLDRGVCSDKTFLAVALLRKLGYGAAILDFPDINHTAAGIACPTDVSLNGSGYCYVETTNYFPFSVIPQNINGQATTTNEFVNLFDPTGLGKIEIRQRTTGKIYQGAAAVYSQVDNLKTLKAALGAGQTELDTLNDLITSQEASLNNLKAQMDVYQNNGQISQYNALVSNYNALADKYNSNLALYRTKVATFNDQVVAFNQATKSFYQQ